MKLTLRRLSDDGKQTLGILSLPNGKVFHTLELSWKNNEKKVSCIPKGNYRIYKRNTAKYGWHFILADVPNRDYILIHFGNYHYDILGCILIGKGLKDINSDGLLDVISSKQAMKELNAIVEDGSELNIVSV